MRLTYSLNENIFNLLVGIVVLVVIDSVYSITYCKSSQLASSPLN